LTLLRNARLVLPGGILPDGWLRTADGLIAGCGGPDAPHAPRLEGLPPKDIVDLDGALLVPGFVDMHVHGGGGASFTTGDPNEALRAVEFHRGHGTTTTIASTVTAALPDLQRQVSNLAGLVEDGVLAGVHLEGPFLSKVRCGAHDPSLLRAPEQAVLADLVAAGRGTVRMVTIAPELPGGLDAVQFLAEQGIVAAIGHTDAAADQTKAALRRGASVATHLFNAMRSLHHRHPSAANALLDDGAAVLELVNDGFHVDPSLISLVFKAVGADRVALITDAIVAAGMPDGAYRLGALPIEVTAGVARLTDRDGLAGSTMTMDVAFRRAVHDIGLSISQASVAASLTPARAIGVADKVGSLEAGKRADLVVLDDALNVIAVMARGVWVGAPALSRQRQAPAASADRTPEPTGHETPVPPIPQ
jgi:N-acetylglucosamine-6-phosphate deacetylase